MDIYISTLAIRKYSPEEIVDIALQNNWAIEFSSGMDYRCDLQNFYESLLLKRIPHNYFPAPEVPFVLNLASIDNEIREKSINHCINGLELASSSNSPFFSAHAGFCIDPDPKQLGHQILYNSNFDREVNKKYFLESIRLLTDKAKELNIQFLIENNVIAGFNFNDGINPFLCCDSFEMRWLVENIDDPHFGILLDTAHLKVSCKTLGLNKELELLKLQSYIKAIHHSDNDGNSDDNLLLSKDYWFLPHMNKFKTISHVLEVKDLSPSQINNQINLLSIC